VFAGNAGLALASLLTQVVLARALGIDEFGRYTYAFTWVVVLALPTKLGFDTASIRFVSRYLATGDWARLKGYLRQSGIYVGLSGLVVATVCWLGADRMESLLLRHGARPAVMLAILVVPLYALQLTRSGAAQGLRRIWLGQTAELSRLLSVTALVATATWIFGRRLEAADAIALQGPAILLALIVLWTGLWHRLNPEWRGIAPVTEPREWAMVALPLLLVSATHVIMKRTDVLMLGSMIGPAAAGAYAVAARFSDLMIFGLTAANSYAAPMMSELHTLGKTEDLQRVARLTARVGALTTFVALLVLVIGSGLLLRLFGPGFEMARPALLILAGGQLINALAGSVGLLMAMTGHQVESSIVLAVSAGLNVGLNYLLIPRYGLVGAALATGISTVVWNVTLAVRVRRLLGVRSTAF
jgi:O-antigen/teichoic acid export membrane protein